MTQIEHILYVVMYDNTIYLQHISIHADKQNHSFFVAACTPMYLITIHSLYLILHKSALTNLCVWQHVFFVMYILTHTMVFVFLHMWTYGI